MASPFQQKSRRRKLIYISLMLALFTFAYGFRQYAVVAQAEELALREKNLGEVELAGSAVRWGLTGMRGVVVCMLWHTAQEKQKRNQWNELELIVDSLTKLQPHFVTPWLFQSWNLAYNVSVESDRENDQYFYISRGIQLLAKGEKQNNNHPDLRWAMAFYNQNKIGQSDKTVVMRCLYEMSCIPPYERDPARFRVDEGKGLVSINLGEFEDFCKRHPRLVRRLRGDVRYGSQFKLSSPQAIVQFLDENFTVPSLYEDTKKAPLGGWVKITDPKYLPVAERFPVLPPDHVAAAPQELFDPQEINEDQPSRLVDDDYWDWFDCFSCARAWYGYAQEPLPPTGELPGIDKPIEDRTKQRLPKFTTAIFRNAPARAQSYVAEELHNEGWFDSEGWQVVGWFRKEAPGGGFKDQFQDGSPPLVGGGKERGERAWTRAYQMWKDHGERDHLYLPAEMQARLRRETEYYRSEYGAGPANVVPIDPAREQKRSPEDQQRMKESVFAFQYLQQAERVRFLTNFEHFYLRSQVEMRRESVAARKALFEARRQFHLGDRAKAIEIYEAPGTFPYWRTLLEKEEFGADSGAEEELYAFQIRYLRCVHELHDEEFKQVEAVAAILGETAATPVPSYLSINQLLRPNFMPQPTVVGPFDGNTNSGRPIIGLEARNAVEPRFGMTTKRPGDQPGPPVPQVRP